MNTQHILYVSCITPLIFCATTYSMDIPKQEKPKTEDSQKTSITLGASWEKTQSGALEYRPDCKYYDYYPRSQAAPIVAISNFTNKR